MTLLPAWTPEQKRLQREGVVTFTHGLAETGLFGDEALAKLIDAHPRDLLDVCTMRPNPPPGEPWIAGDPGALSGAELIEAVRRGHLWVSVRQGMNGHPETRPVLAGMMAGFAGQTGAKVLSTKGSILISGPRMGIFFHVDTSETMLWHVRGHKMMFVYPAEERFVPERALEAILLKENLSDAPWRPDMEAHATQVPLGPGEAAHWPLNAPHRVLNGPDLNVSVAIEYATPRSRAVNGTFYLNGVLRRRFGLNSNSRRVPDALRPAYWAAATAIKTLAPPKANAENAHVREFDVDLSEPEGLRWREGFASLETRKAA